MLSVYKQTVTVMHGGDPFDEGISLPVDNTAQQEDKEFLNLHQAGLGGSPCLYALV